MGCGFALWQVQSTALASVVTIAAQPHAAAPRIVYFGTGFPRAYDITARIAAWLLQDRKIEGTTRRTR